MATQTDLPFFWEQVDSLSDLNRLFRRYYSILLRNPVALETGLET